MVFHRLFFLHSLVYSFVGGFDKLRSSWYLTNKLNCGHFVVKTFLFCSMPSKPQINLMPTVWWAINTIHTYSNYHPFTHYALLIINFKFQYNVQYYYRWRHIFVKADLMAKWSKRQSISFFWSHLTADSESALNSARHDIFHLKSVKPRHRTSCTGSHFSSFVDK